VLAEAIKKSSISIDKLFLVVNENNITPDWEHMLLPIGKFCDLQLKLSEQGSPG
jgi:hypothetical protein